MCTPVISSDVYSCMYKAHSLGVSRRDSSPEGSKMHGIDSPTPQMGRTTGGGQVSVRRYNRRAAATVSSAAV